MRELNGNQGRGGGGGSCHSRIGPQFSSTDVSGVSQLFSGSSHQQRNGVRRGEQSQNESVRVERTNNAFPWQGHGTDMRVLRRRKGDEKNAALCPHCDFVTGRWPCLLLSLVPAQNCFHFALLVASLALLEKTIREMTQNSHCVHDRTAIPATPAPSQPVKEQCFSLRPTENNQGGFWQQVEGGAVPRGPEASLRPLHASQRSQAQPEVSPLGAPGPPGFVTCRLCIVAVFQSPNP